MINPKYLYLHGQDLKVLFRHTSVVHYIDLPNGMTISSAEFHFEDEKDKFETYQVQPICADGETATAAHAQLLGQFGVIQGHTLKQVRTALKKVHPLF